MIHGVMSQLF